MQYLKTIHEVIHPVSSISIIVVLFSLLKNYKKNKAKNGKIFILLTGYVVIDLMVFFLSPYFSTHYKSNLPIINLNYITDSIITISILEIEFIRLKKALFLIKIFLALTFVINILSENSSLFTSLNIYKLLKTLTLFSLSVFLLIYKSGAKKINRKQSHILVLLTGIAIYNLPLPYITYDFYSSYFENLQLSLSTNHLTCIIISSINIIRNISISVYAHNFK